MKYYENILLQKEKLQLLKFIKTVVKDLGEYFPGLQSLPNLHEYKELKIFLNKIKPYITGYKIVKCWANYSNGDFLNWHDHPDSDISMVYYLKNKSKIGTIFKLKGTKVMVTKCKENSISIFDSRLIHSVPCHLPEERYILSLDLLRKEKNVSGT